MQRYADRTDAGARLAEELEPVLRDAPDPMILAVPRGGVVIGDVVAEALGLPLDVLVVEKIGHPSNPELAVGAVGEKDALWLDELTAGRLDPEALQARIERERQELEAKLRLIRAVRPRVPVEGRTAVVVDDGVATGATVRAALLALREARPAGRVLAVPVGPPETLHHLERIADAIVCPLRPRAFYAVGQWYEVFGQVSDDEVLSIIKRHRPEY
ncbi:MAG: phosphoribosyltransferase [Acidobacteriota bacterium]